MKISSIALKTPSRCVSNDEIIERIRQQNRQVPKSSLERYCRLVERLLAAAGAETRFIRDKDRGERAHDLLMAAVRSAIAGSGVGRDEIDLIIYCGVGRAFVEPANGLVVAKALGITCDCFDISEACMSWVRALQVAYSFLATRAYANILIVNAEFTAYEGGLLDNLNVLSAASLRYTFPALTIGEAATATIVTASDKQWLFRFRTVPDLVAACHVPLAGYADYVQPGERLGLNGICRLVSFGSELSAAAGEIMTRFVRETYADLAAIDRWFPHAASETDIQAFADRFAVNDRLYSGVFRRYGNLISASIPAGMALAEAAGELRRGNRIVLCPSSAGMVFALVEGEF